MDKSYECAEKIFAGEKASIENTGSKPIAISLVSDKGCCIEFDLMPKQVIGFAAGDANAKVVLPAGDPTGLLIIKPELPS